MNPSIPERLFDTIVTRLGSKRLPEEFESIFQAVRSDRELASILQESDDELEGKMKKLAYAKIILNDAVYAELGEEWIMSSGMNLDKLCTIAIGEPGTSELTDGGLNIEQVEAMTGEHLADELMTVDKITLIGFGATPQQIQDIGPEEIAKMSLKELSSLLRF